MEGGVQSMACHAPQRKSILFYSAGTLSSSAFTALFSAIWKDSTESTVRAPVESDDFDKQIEKDTGYGAGKEDSPSGTNWQCHRALGKLLRDDILETARHAPQYPLHWKDSFLLFHSLKTSSY